MRTVRVPIAKRLSLSQRIRPEMSKSQQSWNRDHLKNEIILIPNERLRSVMSKVVVKDGQAKESKTTKSKTLTRPGVRERQSFTLLIETRLANGKTLVWETLWEAGQDHSLLDVTIFNPIDTTDQYETL